MGRKVSIWERVVAVLLWIIGFFLFTWTGAYIIVFTIFGLIAYGLLTHNYWLATYLLVFYLALRGFARIFIRD